MGNNMSDGQVIFKRYSVCKYFLHTAADGKKYNEGKS